MTSELTLLWLYLESCHMIVEHLKDWALHVRSKFMLKILCSA